MDRAALVHLWSASPSRSHVLASESQVSEYPDGAASPALEITGGEALARRELIGCAQDGFRRVTAVALDQLVGCGRSETMVSEEPLRSESVYSFIARNTSARETLSHASERGIAFSQVSVVWYPTHDR